MQNLLDEDIACDWFAEVYVDQFKNIIKIAKAAIATIEFELIFQNTNSKSKNLYGMEINLPKIKGKPFLSWIDDQERSEKKKHAPKFDENDIPLAPKFKMWSSNKVKN